MNVFSQPVVKYTIWLAAATVIIVVFHLGGQFSHVVGQFAPVTGAFLGGSLTLWSAALPRKRHENTQEWLGFEQVSWLLVGVGILSWGVGDSFWRYYVSIGQAPFPSIADAGYVFFPLLAFVGLLLMPQPEAKGGRVVLLMDSTISMGSIFALSWFLLLGSLAQAPGEASLAKFLGLYYPVSDTALISCIIFLLLRGQGHAYQSTARRMSLLVIGLGICFFVTSDFLFNIQNNAGTYVEATWVDLGWPLGMMTIGVGAYMRRFLPVSFREVLPQHMPERRVSATVSPPQFVPYVLLGLLLLALTLNVLSPDAGQRAIRPVLLFSTLLVVGLVVFRQVYTLLENIRLSARQAEALDELEKANRRVEEQSHQIADHSIELENGIRHLTETQAKIANGNLQARAQLKSGVLLPLAGSLNLMAERLARLGEGYTYAQRVLRAMGELSIALERAARGTPLVVPESWNNLPEVNRLLVALGAKNLPSPHQSQEGGRKRTPLPAPYASTQTLPPYQSGPVQQNRSSRPAVYPNTTAPQTPQAASEVAGQGPSSTSSTDRPFPARTYLQRSDEGRT